MGKSSSPPPAPDPYDTAAAQTGQNVGTAIANTTVGQVNRVTPDGSLTYEQTGMQTWTDPNSGQVYELPQYTAYETLSDDQQALRDENNRANLALATLGADQAEQLGGFLDTPFDASAVSPERFDRSTIIAPELERDTRALPTDDYGAQKDEVVDALFGQIDEQRARDREDLETRLLNQGIGIGTEAWSRAIEDFDASIDEARTSALLAGGQEQSRMAGLDNERFRMGSDQLAYNNSIAQQGLANERALADDQDRSRAGALDEAYAARNQPINEISALL
ncbi:MAG: tail fiber domain-containing protein, partial [Pseudomonadota bacterium]